LREKTRQPRRGRRRTRTDKLCVGGMRIGYTEKEVAHMYFGKWCDLFEEFKKMHNITMRRQVFEQQKIASMMDL